jgi:hypothetical protein
MNGLIRKAVFLVVASAFVSSAAVAGVPGWANSTQPGVIRVGVPVGGVGQASTAATYTIRDANNLPVSNTRVKLDFSGCTGITICAVQDAGITKVGATVEGTTNGSGVITFRVRGFATGATGYAGTCVNVTLTDNPVAGSGNALVAAAYDLNGSTGIDAGDLSIWGGDANTCAGGTHRGRSDYTGSGSCPGGVDASDLSQWGAGANEAAGQPSCAP